MGILVAILLLVLAVVFGVAILGLFAKLVYFAIVGLVVGALARLVLPGRQDISLAMTALLGLAGALVGGVLADLLGAGTLISLVFSVAAAALLVTGFASRDRDRVGSGRRRRAIRR